MLFIQLNILKRPTILALVAKLDEKALTQTGRYLNLF